MKWGGKGLQKGYPTIGNCVNNQGMEAWEGNSVEEGINERRGSWAEKAGDYESECEPGTSEDHNAWKKQVTWSADLDPVAEM